MDWLLIPSCSKYLCWNGPPWLQTATLCCRHRPGIATWCRLPHTLFQNLFTLFYSIFYLPRLLLEGFGAGAYSVAVAALTAYKKFKFIEICHVYPTRVSSDLFRGCLYAPSHFSAARRSLLQRPHGTQETALTFNYFQRPLVEHYRPQNWGLESFALRLATYQNQHFLGVNLGI